MMDLFDGIALWEKPLHDQVSLYGELERGNRGSEDLKIHQKGGSVNHEHGWDACAVRQVLAGIEDTGFPEHAARLDEVVDYVADQCAAERRDGHCFGEVLSSNYRFLSRFYRTATLRDTLRLLEHFPGHAGLLRLAGELRTWIQIDRFLDRVFQAQDGIVHSPGIRCKKEPELNESCSLAAHCHERGVTDRFIADEIHKLGNPSVVTLQSRPHEVIAYRLYMSEAGRRIEAATRGVVQGRLSARVGVHPLPGGGQHSVMPQITNIAESRGFLPQIVWEVKVNHAGIVTERIATNHLAIPADRKVEIKARRGEVVKHPLDAVIPLGWLVLGPGSPIPEAPPWQGAGGDPPPPEEPDEPQPQPQPDLLEPFRERLKAEKGRWGWHRVLTEIKDIRGVTREEEEEK